MTQRPILTITLNPALDMTTSVQKLEPQRKLRCEPALLHAGGGGANVSRAIHELGGGSQAFVALGGHTGEQYVDLLRAAGVDCVVYPLAGETRTSVTVMEDETGLHYRLVLPGPPQPPETGDEMLAAIGRLMGEGGGYVVASGSLLPGLDEDFYARLGVLARRSNVRLILDSHGASLRKGLEGRPYLLRVNQIEAEELVGTGSSARTPAEIARELVRDGSAEVVVFAMGERGSLVTTRDSQFIVSPPRVVVHSMVGAGDSYVAALTLALARGEPIEVANRWGVAAAAAAVSREATQLCDRASTERYLSQTIVADYAERAEVH